MNIFNKKSTINNKYEYISVYWPTAFMSNVARITKKAIFLEEKKQTKKDAVREDLF